MSEPEEIGPEELHQLVRLLRLVPIPEPLVPAVLAKVRAYRESMRRFEEADIDVSGVVTAQPFRADMGGDRR